MSCGGSVGDGYGPMLVSTRSFTPDEIKGKKIAVPGKLTTAYLALELFAPGIDVEVVPFDQIIPQILEGKHEAGLIIHEGQLTYDKSGLHRVVDLGKWWQKVTGLPLPLGGNAIRRSLGPETMASVTQALRESIQYAIDHREEALAYAMQFARDLDTQLADKFVGMYVNERTLDYGDDGREAVKRLLDMGHKAGIIPQDAESGVGVRRLRATSRELRAGNPIFRVTIAGDSSKEELRICNWGPRPRSPRQRYLYSLW